MMDNVRITAIAYMKATQSMIIGSSLPIHTIILWHDIYLGRDIQLCVLSLSYSAQKQLISSYR